MTEALFFIFIIFIIVMVAFIVKTPAKPKSSEGQNSELKDELIPEQEIKTKQKSYKTTSYFKQTIKWCVVVFAIAASIRFIILPGVPTEFKVNLKNSGYSPLEIELRSR